MDLSSPKTHLMIGLGKKKDEMEITIRNHTHKKSNGRRICFFVNIKEIKTIFAKLPKRIEDPSTKLEMKRPTSQWVPSSPEQCKCIV